MFDPIMVLGAFAGLYIILFGLAFVFFPKMQKEKKTAVFLPSVLVVTILYTAVVFYLKEKGFFLPAKEETITAILSSPALILIILVVFFISGFAGYPIVKKLYDRASTIYYLVIALATLGVGSFIVVINLLF